MITSFQPRALAEARPSAVRLAAVAVAILPVGLAIGISLLAPRFFNPMSVGPEPTLAGVPISLLVNGLAVSWAYLGSYAFAHATSLLGRLVALALFSFPAAFVFIAGPAIVLILQNLG